MQKFFDKYGIQILFSLFLLKWGYYMVYHTIHPWLSMFFTGFAVLYIILRLIGIYKYLK